MLQVQSCSRPSEAIAHGCINICIILELAEEGVRIITEEYICAGLDRQIVADFIIDVRPHINILIRRRIVCE